MRNRRSKRITYRPGKTQAIIGSVASGVFVLIGIFVVIPVFGVFGSVWTLFAAGITCGNLYALFGKSYVGGEFRIEDDPTADPWPMEHGAAPEEEDPADRLKQLRTLYDQRLITQEEYEEKRKDILKEL